MARAVSGGGADAGWRLRHREHPEVVVDASGAAVLRPLRDGLLVAGEYAAEALSGLIRPAVFLSRRPRAFMDCSWSFVLIPEDGGTRSLMRTRIGMHPGWLLPVASLVRAGDAVLQRALLAGIKRHVERRGDQPDPPTVARPSRLTLGELANVWVDEPVAPFQIALAGQFDATSLLRDDGTVDLPRLRAELVSRAGRVPELRRRVIWTRWGRGRPYWVDDPSFDPARHVRSTALPDGVTFLDWCAEQIVRPLDRDRPLWQADIVSGLPGARFGVLIIVHHAVADGLTGVVLAASLMDTAPQGPPGRPAPAGPLTATAPGAPPPPSLPARLRQRWRQLADAAADLRSRAPVTSLSGPIRAQRKLATVRVPLEDLRHAGHRLGVTVNDLLLAAVTGGLRELLAARGDDLAGLVLRTTVPVGARGAGQATGMLVVGLPVGDPDPLCRLAAIHADTSSRKTRLQRGGGNVLDVLHLPTPAARQAVRWMRRAAGRGINLFVTNVPGPDTPLTLAGARLQEAVPIAPLVRGVPLGIAALSYAGTLHICIDADAAVDDLDVLTDGMERSVALLLDAAASGGRLPPAPSTTGSVRDRTGIVENTIGVPTRRAGPHAARREQPGGQHVGRSRRRYVVEPFRSAARR